MNLIHPTPSTLGEWKIIPSRLGIQGEAVIAFLIKPNKINLSHETIKNHHPDTTFAHHIDN